MCGICGLIHVDNSPVERSLIEKMTNVIRHRGPDDEGLFLSNNVGFGFRRLSIIDLAGGHQPMANEDQSIQIVFNGEIYNFVELRDFLKSKGHIFKTNTDTETIVHGYEEWGDQVVDHLNGMFAFAIWDENRKRTLLARDRMGIKPLFYSSTGNTFSFASEMKCLTLLPGFDATLNEQAIFDFFIHQFVPEPRSIYKNIHKLCPGELLTFENGSVSRKRFWSTPTAPIITDRSVSDWCDELRECLIQSVKYRMIADVPLGVFLSGGVDSSALTAAMSKTGSEEIKSYSIGFDVPEFDETPYAERIGKMFGTTHKTMPLEGNITDLLPEILWYLDEPMADPTIIPTYLLCKMTREHVTVALSGEGGDELFAGYSHYKGLKINRRLGIMPTFLRSALAGIFGSLPNFGSPRLGFLNHRISRVLQSSLFPLDESYLKKAGVILSEEQDSIFTPAFRERSRGFPFMDAFVTAQNRADSLDPVAAGAYADLTVNLPGLLLVKADRMSMANSLEVRVPLLDHTFVELASSIPFDLKLKGMKSKSIFKEALKPWLPDDILNRKKQGFSPPLEYWLHSGVEEYVKKHQITEALKESGYINIDTFRALIKQHTSGKRNYARKLWPMLVFGVWWNHTRVHG